MKKTLPFFVALLLLLPACNGAHALPSAGAGAAPNFFAAPRVDTTSVLKTLTKQSVIGSTIDAKNGDRGPRGLAITPPFNLGMLKKSSLLTCNFADKSNVAGNGTTIEQLNTKAGSKPVRFVQSNAIKGCTDLTVTTGGIVWVASPITGTVSAFNDQGKAQKTPSGFKAPFQIGFATIPSDPYPPDDIFVGDAGTGYVWSINVQNWPQYIATQIASGFAVSGTGGSALGPSGLQYDTTTDTLYIADGVTNTVVAFDHASTIQVKNAIVVQPGGKTFKYAKGESGLAHVVYAGSSLNKPLAAALLPNGNLIVANTGGGNTLVEITSTGKVLDTKVVDSSPTAGIFGLLATGTTDANTSLYFTDSNANNVQVLQH